MNQNLWGPSNPHPLSKTKTELIWEGKYDEYGNRREIKLPSTPYPLQKIEAIDEPHDRIKADRVVQDEIFDETKFNESNHPDDFRNMLIWGDNKLVMASLLEKYRGQVDLIYIDPPFDVGADFTMKTKIGTDSINKEQSVWEAVAYRDTWGKGIDSYLHMLYERISLAYELLSDQGSFYLHCDWRVNRFVSHLISEVFGSAFNSNEIMWKRHTMTSSAEGGLLNYSRKVESIFFATKGSSAIFNPPFQPIDENDALEKFNHVEHETGRRFETQPLILDGNEPNTLRFADKGVITLPKGKRFAWNQETLDKRVRENPFVIYWTSSGTPRYKKYLDNYPGDPCSNLWDDINAISSNSSERLGYATQKPEALLERIIMTSSKEDSIVADFFCGSGTTLAVAEKSGRKWIGVDLGRYSIHTTRKRLIQVQRDLYQQGKQYRSFDVYNLGRYERQWWQKEKLHGADTEHRATVMKFYKASELVNPPSSLLHGKKGGALIHIDEIDGMFTGEELVNVAKAASMAGAKEVHILAWEFEMELTTRKQAIEAEHNVQIKLFYIPREIMESNRTECQFFEAGYLKAAVLRDKEGKIDVALESFIPSLAEAPEKELSALRERSVKSPFDFIDFWAVDFEYSKDKPFEHHWQDFRIKKKRTLATKTDLGWKYHDSGKHEICVKVIDVFGVDTTIVMPVEV